MRIALPIAFLLLVLSSCSRFQYGTIQSSNLLLNDKSEFVAENDTLRIRYNFNGEYAPINFTIENKLDVPLYIDWQQSALVVNDKAVSYVPGSVPVEGVINSSGVDINSRGTSFTSSSGTISGRAGVPSTIDFIPPHSHIVKRPAALTNRVIRDAPGANKVRINTEDGPKVVSTAAYNENNSPIRFRSYLSVMVGEARAKRQSYEHRFFVSELTTTGLNLRNSEYIKVQPGNYYYIKEKTGMGKTAAGFGVIAGTAVIAGAAAAIAPGNQHCNNCQ